MQRITHLVSTRATAQIERDVRAELEAHIELASAEYIAAGDSPEEARRKAEKAFGNYEGTVRRCLRQKKGNEVMWKIMHWVATASLSVGLLVTLRQSAELEAEISASHVEVEFAKSLLASRPAPEMIRIAIGDRIELVPTYHPADLGVTVEVARDGTVLLPSLGHVYVFGLTRKELEERLNTDYRVYYEPVLLFVRIHPLNPTNWIGLATKARYRIESTTAVTPSWTPLHVGEEVKMHSNSNPDVLNVTATVAEDFTIQLPYLGQHSLEGLSPHELEIQLRALYESILPGLDLEVRVRRK